MHIHTRTHTHLLWAPGKVVEIGEWKPVPYFNKPLGLLLKHS